MATHCKFTLLKKTDKQLIGQDCQGAYVAYTWVSRLQPIIEFLKVGKQYRGYDKDDCVLEGIYECSGKFPS